MAELKLYQEDMTLSGGRACLNFANTVGGHRPDRPREYLLTYDDLIAWSCHAGILSQSAAQQLAQAAERRPVEAAQTLAQAIIWREAIYRIFSAIAVNQAPQPTDLAILNTALSETLARLQIIATPNDFIWAWPSDETALDMMLWPVVRSAGELLTSPERARVRECAGDTCSWLFIDASRNHSRRWCDMKDCGNRAKAKRHYARSRAAQMG